MGPGIAQEQGVEAAPRVYAGDAGAVLHGAGDKDLGQWPAAQQDDAPVGHGALEALPYAVGAGEGVLLRHLDEVRPEHAGRPGQLARPDEHLVPGGPPDGPVEAVQGGEVLRSIGVPGVVQQHAPVVGGRRVPPEGHIGTGGGEQAGVGAAQGAVEGEGVGLAVYGAALHPLHALLLAVAELRVGERLPGLHLSL